MEPALDERGDRVNVLLISRYRGAAMEPALDERGDPTSGRIAFTELRGRNGARSRRAGRPSTIVGHSCSFEAAMEPALDERGDSPLTRVPSCQPVPQWSPLSTSGATR